MIKASTQLAYEFPEDDGEPDNGELFFDGYIAAIAVSPQDVPFSTWAVPLFGKGNAPPQDEMEQALDGLRSLLTIAPDEYIPLYCRTEENFTASGLLYAAGFMAGMAAANAAWVKRMTGADYWNAIEPFATLAMQRDDFTTTLPAPYARPEPLSEEEIEECLDMLPDCVVALSQLRLKRLATPPRHLTAKPGRNDPCTCGSGKKYKKCCGK